MVTIKDVAKLAGVSPSTASRAMNDNSMISEATKERVRRAMQELNYSPNYSAQSLVNRQTNMVGVILPVRENQDFLGNNPFFMQIIQGITGVCTDYHYMVSLATGRTEDELLQNLQNLIRSGNIAKFIFLYSKKEDPIYAFMIKQDVSCVVVGQPYQKSNKETIFVDNDNYTAGYDATSFLLEKGYQDICYAYTDLDELVQADRFFGYQKAMDQANCVGKSLRLSRIDNQDNLQNLSKFLEKTSKLQAFVACDDVMGIRLQKLFKQLGISSRRYAIISFNNSIVAELATPGMTSVEIFPEKLGEKAAQLLLEKTIGKEMVSYIGHDIIERQSSPTLRNKAVRE